MKKKQVQLSHDYYYLIAFPISQNLAPGPQTLTPISRQSLATFTSFFPLSSTFPTRYVSDRSP